MAAVDERKDGIMHVEGPVKSDEDVASGTIDPSILAIERRITYVFAHKQMASHSSLTLPFQIAARRIGGSSPS